MEETDPPELTALTLSFNGKGGLGHEQFIMDLDIEVEPGQRRPRTDELGRYFQFCKTARKPYDLAVCAALIAAKHHFPEMKVTSDGEESDWKDACDLCQRVLGFGAAFTLDPDTVAA